MSETCFKHKRSCRSTAPHNVCAMRQLALSHAQRSKSRCGKAVRNSENSSIALNLALQRKLFFNFGGRTVLAETPGWNFPQVLNRLLPVGKEKRTSLFCVPLCYPLLLFLMFPLLIFYICLIFWDSPLKQHLQKMTFVKSQKAKTKWRLISISYSQAEGATKQLEIWLQRPMYFAATIAMHHSE